MLHKDNTNKVSRYVHVLHSDLIWGWSSLGKVDANSTGKIQMMHFMDASLSLF